MYPFEKDPCWHSWEGLYFTQLEEACNWYNEYLLQREVHEFSWIQWCFKNWSVRKGSKYSDEQSLGNRTQGASFLFSPVSFGRSYTWVCLLMSTQCQVCAFIFSLLNWLSKLSKSFPIKVPLIEATIRVWRIEIRGFSRLSVLIMNGCGNSPPLWIERYIIYKHTTFIEGIKKCFNQVFLHIVKFFPPNKWKSCINCKCCLKVW